MARSSSTFFRYRLPHAEAVHWGIGVQGGGTFLARAGEPYPPVGHPSDHLFDWRTGRVLGTYQVVYVAQGRGQFESKATGLVEVVAGSALLLFPGVWHRYRPEPALGWTEKWIEFNGLLPQRLTKAGMLTPAQAVLAVARTGEMEARLDSLHDLLKEEGEGREGELASLTLGVLALFHAPRPSSTEVKPLVLAVAKAKRLLEDEGASQLPLPDLARSLGVAYSSFRREFRRRTGLSPQQYQLRMRLQRVQRLLGSTDLAVKEIADRLGFSSPYHLSAAFSAYFGLSPSDWRRQSLSQATHRT